MESTPLKIDILDESRLDRSQDKRSTCDKTSLAPDQRNVDKVDRIESDSNGPVNSKQRRAQFPSNKHQNSIIHRIYLSPFVFPILYTSLFQVVFTFSPIGGAGNPAMGLARVYALRQVVSLFGEIYLVFWIGWLATITIGLGIIQHPNKTRHIIPNSHVVAFAAVTLFMFLYGSVRELSGRGFYLMDISQWPATQASEAPLRVSCVTAAESGGNQTALQKMVRRTNERLAAGDDLVMWSESAVDVVVSPDMFAWNSENRGAVVAPTFYQQPQGGEDNNNSAGKVYNRMQMMQEGVVIASYDKNRPVPIIESYVVGGSAKPHTTEVTFTPRRTSCRNDGCSALGTPPRQTLELKTAMAICFDFDFSYLLQNAYNADLVIGPSWYWASIGYNLWGHNIFRAIENGFTLIKCSEYGMTGAVDPYGRPMAAFPTLNEDVHTFEVPVQTGIGTVFGSGGWMFGWVCVGFSPVVILLLMTGRFSGKK
jgi:apolipoprotein N-acyltransferase